jgi:hypothetical protein
METMTADQLARLETRITDTDQWERNQREALQRDSWALELAGVRLNGGDSLRVTLRPLAADGEITLTLPRQTWKDCRLEPGAVWTLLPGPRPEGYRERLQAARRALLAVGGDLEQLSEEHRGLIIESDQPF